MQLRPNEQTGIVYLISDTTDNNTYYVQAIIRDTKTGSVLSTTNLTQDSNNGRRFFATVQAPTDPSNQGRWVDITVTVYIDSGYSTKSPIYPETLNTYLVQERWSTVFGGNGGVDVNYEKIEKLLKTFSKSIVGSIKIPKTKIPDIERIVAQNTKKLSFMVRALPTVQHIEDLKKSHSTLEKSISNLPNLTHILQIVESIGTLGKGVDAHPAKVIKSLTQELNVLKDEVLSSRDHHSKHSDKILSIIDEMKKTKDKDRLLKMSKHIKSMVDSGEFDGSVSIKDDEVEKDLDSLAKSLIGTPPKKKKDE